MILTGKTAAEKRAAFRSALSNGELLRCPGAFAPLVAMLVEQSGFDGVYVSGAGISAEAGLPDIGLTNQEEVVGRAHNIAKASDLPTIVDIDTGFGEPMNAARTIIRLEEMGLAGCHMEDQINPKRCGHLDNKALVETPEMCRKLRAAAEAKRDPNFILIARTDARAPEGLESAIERAKAYADSGADMIFPEALETEAEFEAFRSAIDLPLLANMTEFGKSPLLDTGQLAALGFNLVIYPMTTMRLALKAINDGLAILKEDGTQAALVEHMWTRSRLYEALGYAKYNQFDQDIYNFDLDR
ncbi:MAG: methylisocitrate lyase [Rhodospirillaceae bacterium]|nr:methylisocitrate lyase [Rhodospirillaceae bacterium]MBT3926158.1 methylisocitrate lyase [Rhodospirillaceae bacterium]MBT5037199.1 methylisocitrate lyase [Rhodospirillaceae bacterium]MBT5777857.1 methylisocitrate lyase [Rhodospirillaceae bacterium]MBT7294598.1 methylisocitrate lyase [Rhodospirillaceae bacterium]